ncbi:hypothetical protein TNCV_3677491 [Trichonephila clavipes]|nr:hypothetical protein TNCV_3677491 [Trichonephila clavipes]
MGYHLSSNNKAIDKVWYQQQPLKFSEQFNAEIVEVEIGGVAIYIVLSGNFAELNRTVICMVLKANDRRTSRPLPR